MMASRRLAVVAVATLAAGGAAGWALTRPDSGAATPPAADPLPTVKVTKQDLVETQEVDGTLGYGEQYAVPGQQGTVTWIAPVGSVVARGKTLYKVDQRPVSLLYGTVPMYRTLQDGVEGADVQQLEENLRALGYTGFTVDDEYTDATAEAVEEWQEDLGRDETGTVQRGDVVFTTTAVRIASHGSVVGGPASGTVLSYTGTTRIVTVPLPVGDQQLAVKGAKVGVELPGGGTTSGTIESVGTVAKAAPKAEGAGQPEANVEDATVDVIVRLDKPSAAGTLDEAPASVHFTSEQRKGVLTVPVAALLALAEGGYGVQVVADGTSKVVAVEVGLFANGRVEISGAGIAAGSQVEVPRT
jgi:hypothetical protein